MNTLTNLHQTEPVLTWGTVVAVLNALQLLAIPGLPTWVHTVILVLTVISGAIAARQQVTPTKPSV